MEKLPVKKSTPFSSTIDVVLIPRSVRHDAPWTSRPFSVLRDLAMRGEDGCCLLRVPAIYRNLLGDGKLYYDQRDDKQDLLTRVPIVVDVSCFRQGIDHDGTKDRAFLYAQNW